MPLRIIENPMHDFSVSRLPAEAKSDNEYHFPLISGSEFRKIILVCLEEIPIFRTHVFRPLQRLLLLVVLESVKHILSQPRQ